MRASAGAWLLAVVATQSIAVLSALVALHWGQPYRLAINFFALSMWLWGGMLYIWMISLIFYRYTFFTAFSTCMFKIEGTISQSFTDFSGFSS